MNYYDIFKRSFSGTELSVMSENAFSKLSEISDCTVFACGEGENISGYALVKDNNIRLICVLPEYRRNGLGRDLLLRCEEHIISKGFDEINIGGTDSPLFIGTVPDSAGFFEKYGYVFEEKYAEMLINSQDLRQADREPSPDVKFGFYGGDMRSLRQAVADVEDEWVQYFDDCEVFCGFAGNEIASFCIVEEDAECLLSNGSRKVGSIGCVGTVPRFRRRGIGLKMVELAARELARRGCDTLFIHYTWVYDWYAKLGFKTFLWQLPGVKRLNSNKTEQKNII